MYCIDVGCGYFIPVVLIDVGGEGDDEVYDEDDETYDFAEEDEFPTDDSPRAGGGIFNTCLQYVYVLCNINVNIRTGRFCRYA